MVAQLPVGTIISYVGQASNLSSLAGQGWLLCDGSPLEPRVYESLYKAIGNSFGGTANTFYLPDFQGLFLRGVDGGSGRDPDAASRRPQKAGGNTGAMVGTVQDCAVQPHSHTYTFLGTDSFELPRQGGGFNPNHVPQQPQTSTNGNGSDHETRPVNASVFYLIFAGNS